MRINIYKHYAGVYITDKPMVWELAGRYDNIADAVIAAIESGLDPNIDEDLDKGCELDMAHFTYDDYLSVIE